MNERNLKNKELDTPVNEGSPSKKKKEIPVNTQSIANTSVLFANARSCLNNPQLNQEVAQMEENLVQGPFSTIEEKYKKEDLMFPATLPFPEESDEPEETLGMVLQSTEKKSQLNLNLFHSDAPNSFFFEAPRPIPTTPPVSNNNFVESEKKTKDPLIDFLESDAWKEITVDSKKIKLTPLSIPTLYHPEAPNSIKFDSEKDAELIHELKKICDFKFEFQEEKFLLVDHLTETPKRRPFNSYLFVGDDGNYYHVTPSSAATEKPNFKQVKLEKVHSFILILKKLPESKILKKSLPERDMLPFDIELRIWVNGNLGGHPSLIAGTESNTKPGFMCVLAAGELLGNEDGKLVNDKSGGFWKYCLAVELLFPQPILGALLEKCFPGTKFSPFVHLTNVPKFS